MISIKVGAKIEGSKPEIILAIVIVSKVLEKYTVETVITELTGGEHMEGSLHYSGYAVDIRSRDISPELMQVISTEIKNALGNDFDVVVEENPSHIHIEFQPKG